MKIKEYKNICKYSDKVLLSKKSNHVTHAISRLHILKEHPEVIRQYSDISIKKFKKNNFFSKSIFFFLNFFLEKKNFYKKNYEKNIDKIDYLIITPLIN